MGSMLTRALMVNGSRLRAALACLVCAGSVWLVAAAQNSRTGLVTGVIDGVRLEGDQYYVSGWACQQGNSSSIEVHIYADHSAYEKPAGTCYRR
jgi:isocitrate lyase